MIQPSSAKVFEAFFTAKAEGMDMALDRADHRPRMRFRFILPQETGPI